MKVFKSIQIGLIILLVLQIALLSGCEEYRELTNDPPKITSFTVPTEVEYGETVGLKVRVIDPEDDPLSYTWDVSDGTLIGDTGPEVQWTAPELPSEEVVPPKVVTVHVQVRDGGEEDASKTASIIVFSKFYRVAQALSGTYTLVSKRVHGEPVEETGVLRLTITTFTRELQNILEGGIQGPVRFVSGTYKLIKPFDERKGTIRWFADGNPTPTISTYTWDGKVFVIFFPATSTQYVYSRGRTDLESFKPSVVTTHDGGDIDPEPIEAIEEEDVDPEPVDIDPEPVEVVEEEDIDPEPANPGGKPIKITDQTFKTKVLDAKSPVVVEFRADWCPFCRQMKPIVEAVASEHRKTIIIGLLDIDENPQTTGEYKVNGIPAYIVFQDGAEVARFAGAMPKTVFVQKILDALK